MDRTVLGGKAAVLAELLAAGFPVPSGFVVTAAAVDDPALDTQLVSMACRVRGDRFAVRSSAAAEDLVEASYAGLYETYLNVPSTGLGDAVRRCFAAAGSERVTAYHDWRGGGAAAMAALVQTMVDAVCAGVAFTAHPVAGDRNQTVVTAVAGLGDSLVSGETTGEEWTITEGAPAAMTRQGPGGDAMLTGAQAAAVAQLARRVADRYDDRPQDIEWAIDREGTLWLLQARPMTALPEPVSWTAPGPGLWMRNFRLGEWLPEAATPLFATWLLPVLEDGYLDGMHATVGVRVPFRYDLVNGWYYNATPILSPKVLARVLRHGGLRAVKILYNALIQVSRDPAAADRAVLSGLEREWRDNHAPRYRRLVTTAAAEADTATPQRLAELVDALGREAGIWLWFLAIVGGSAWKMEARLTRFTRQHLGSALPESDGGAQVLLRGLAQPVTGAHAVQSLDWYHPVAGELPTLGGPEGAVARRRVDLSDQRTDAERRCRHALADRPRLLAEFDQLLLTNQRYAVIREEQAREFTLAWPVLRTCARRLGEHLAGIGAIDTADDVHFCTRDELTAALAGNSSRIVELGERRNLWQRQRRLTAPLTLGRPPRLIGDVVDRAVQVARGARQIPEGALVGQPASAGRATGQVHVVHGPDDFASFADGNVLVAKATAPAWTPLFARAAAVVTDGGTLAAHASLVAREYGIPAVVGAGDATRWLHTGQLVTVDGTTGVVTVDTRTAGPPQ
ncbi:pyruvate,water dikinase [Kribbella orskensis]|uniref:Pyruvate,water dikinase n=1 Tax=Kribbella orskensis TaxID=2512216 RepID=A0ABY2B806_9ACTN|nr:MULTISPECIES: PEP/pyruvate-binding domain-containing protein [Kribbella]TCN30648.1 pyruvate,water dikinase [Kribbella sp. VKM Ac-2500]TCO11367.1 pyruvate,water dikinase [Kribbella orskensis]